MTKLDLSTPKGFADQRRELGLTQSQLGHVLNVAPRTVRKWEQDDGTRPVNPIAARVAEWLALGFRPKEWPEKK